MKTLILGAAIVALAGCKSIRVQGVQLAKDRPVFATAILIGGAALIAHGAGGGKNDDGKSPGCKSYIPVSDLKGGEISCAIPLDVYSNTEQ